MVFDFDVKTYVQNLKATKPPYECPVKDCGRVYKSFCGIQFHLYNFDHENPENVVPPTHSNKKAKRKNKWHHRANRRSPTPPEFFRTQSRDTLSYADAQRLVEVDLEGKVHRINIYEPLEIISQDEIDNQSNAEKEEKGEKSPQKVNNNKHPENQKLKKEVSNGHVAIKLPEAQFKVVEDYVKPSNVRPRPLSYYRYIEKSSEELDEEIEYDMDEEDHAWLEIINEKRRNDSLQIITQEVFEILMDRFEKEAFFQSQSSGKDNNPSIDEDAVCSICMDGECQNSNYILFCDMCNLAVHQECYGVPYIPEGQWLCRRCLQSPSRAVDCCLCPNKGGAFKQTDDGRWAHVVCALWIPEVGFANTVFLEPIDSIDHIPPARWKLTCYICRQRGTGACIQCHKTNCYTAFHVTCAQQAGLYMKIEPVRDVVNTAALGVRKTSYCDVHTPADSECTPMLSDENDEKSPTAKHAKAKSRIKMRKARKILAEKRNALPVVSIPTIPQQKITKISGIITLQKKQQFLARLLSYWTLKRQSRNGVPLLRRLQSNHMTRNKEQTKNDKQSNALRAQLKYWQRLRQDLEKARLLVELIRKREKLKREQIRVHQLATEMQLQPFVIFLRHALDQIQEKDVGNIFAEPVSPNEVPDYLEYIEHPMDFSTIRKKVDGHIYKTIDEFQADFELMIKNCLTYNAKDTVFYRAAVRLRDQGGSIVRACKRTIEKVGYDPETGLHLTEAPKSQDKQPVVLEKDFDSFLQDVKEDMPLKEQLSLLLDRMDMTNSIPHGGKRSKFAKRIKKEIIKVRRRLALQRNICSSENEDPAQGTEPSSQGLSASSESGPVLSVKQTSQTCLRSDSSSSMATVSAPPSSKPTSPPLVKSPASSPTSAATTASEKTSSVPLKPTKPTAGRRGRGRLRARSSRSESESDVCSSRRELGGDAKTSNDTSQTVATSAQCCESKASPTPVTPPNPTAHAPIAGVNRRTAVLFTKKLNKTMTPSAVSTPQRKGRPPRLKSQLDLPDNCSTQTFPGPNSKGTGGSGSSGSGGSRGGSSSSSGNVSSVTSSQNNTSSNNTNNNTNTTKASSGVTSPVSASSGRKRTACSTNIGNLNVRDIQPTPPKRGAVSVASDPAHSNMSNSGDSTSNLLPKNSFTQYRIDPTNSFSESDSTSDISSSDESLSDSSSGQSSSQSRSARAHRSTSCDSDDIIPLEPLDLVWAKCRGYPWYPALIINPKMPKTGYFHNGVPIPVPPDEVLALQKKYDEPVYLVLFFDTKRTWQWLPRNKLEPLGVDSGLDKAKLTENRKPNVRKAVRKAYEKAILHRCSVTGDPNPLSGDSSTED
ncbi:peregrin-like isoform X7 [Octopus vulgaris]|uniref:Peregrin-like isoform X7 n=1 Tax=Octopus vulgaris TaxID=6645 RepID=A0AA36EUW8_OCTVU|nr:peregrin-like isoform X7 [Octopus vulgaris]